MHRCRLLVILFASLLKNQTIRNKPLIYICLHHQHGGGGVIAKLLNVTLEILGRVVARQGGKAIMIHIAH